MQGKFGMSCQPPASDGAPPSERPPAGFAMLYRG